MRYRCIPARPWTALSPQVVHLGLEERLLLLALRLQLAVLVCLFLFGLFLAFLLGLDLAGFLALLRFRARCLVTAGGRLAGAIVIVVVYGFKLSAH